MRMSWATEVRSSLKAVSKRHLSGQIEFYDFQEPQLKLFGGDFRVTFNGDHKMVYEMDTNTQLKLQLNNNNSIIIIGVVSGGEWGGQLEMKSSSSSSLSNSAKLFKRRQFSRILLELIMFLNSCLGSVELRQVT